MYESGAESLKTRGSPQQITRCGCLGVTIRQDFEPCKVRMDFESAAAIIPIPAGTCTLYIPYPTHLLHLFIYFFVVVATMLTFFVVEQDR